MRKLIIKPNAIYGKYQALEEIEYTNPGGTVEKRWKCKNVETGEISYKRARALDCRSQQDLLQDEVNQLLVKTNTHQMGIRNGLFIEYKSNARNRGIDFDLSFEEFNSLISSPCHYCGTEPSVLNGGHMANRRHKDQPNLYTNGIDRIDSSKEYSVENCVPCCKKCNMMKNVYSMTDFIDQVHKISNFQKLKESSTTIPEGSTLEASASGSGKLLIEDEDIV